MTRMGWQRACIFPLVRSPSDGKVAVSKVRTSYGSNTHDQWSRCETRLTNAWPFCKAHAGAKGFGASGTTSYGYSGVALIVPEK